jgi:hypothetical protein
MRPFRLAQAVVGAALVVVAGVALLALFGSAGERRDVLAVARRVDAGSQLSAADVRVVSVGSDDAIDYTPASRYDDVVGSYARYDLAEGALVAPDNLQDRPLVSRGHVLMSIVVSSANVPAALAVDDEIAVVVTTDGDCPTRETIAATVTAIRGTPGVAGDSATPVALSVEVPPDAVALLGVTRPDSIAIVRGAVVASDPVGACPTATSTTP